MSDVCLRPAAVLAEMIRRREIGCRELLDRYLERVDRLDPVFHAVVTRDDGAARRRADEADAALARGEIWGPLHGLPVTIKDSWETAAMRTTSGAPALAEHVPVRDADPVLRLRAAGAVIVGKTNVPLFAGDVQSYNEIFPTTNNPWDPARTPGGSSGGAAVAVAAGFTAFELGSDIGGSIRTPASWCGVYGHKSTHGIVPMRGHIPDLPGALIAHDLEVAGPLARSPDDLDLCLEVLAGPTAEASVAWRLSLPPPRHDRLREFRVAAWLDDPVCPVDDEVRAGLEGVVTTLRRAGAVVETSERPVTRFGEVIDDYFRLLLPIIFAGVPDEIFAGITAFADSAPPDDSSIAARMARAGSIRHRNWLAASEARMQLRARMASLFERYDVLLTPVTSVPAIPHDHSQPLDARTVRVNGRDRSYYDLFSWIAVPTMCWLPATVAPAGVTSAGLPVGVQIVGPYLEDRTTIHFARRLADVIGGYVAPPGT